jgi:hypothetical protein
MQSKKLSIGLGATLATLVLTLSQLVHALSLNKKSCSMTSVR